ncbi:MAG: PAS domain S-box protein [Thermodesulfobacteriota bacterium]
MALEGTDTRQPAAAGRDARQTMEELRATLYSIGDGVIATDALGRITGMNPVASELTGWPEADALGRPVKEILQLVHETTGAAVEPPVAEVLQHGQVKNLANHTLLVARDGSQRPIADSGAPIRDLEGRVGGVVLVFRDQTAARQSRLALQESEERYRTVADFTFAWEYWLAPDGAVLYMSPSCHRITGYHPEELAASPDLLATMVVPEDRPLLADHQARVREHDGPGRHELRFRIRRRDGELRWIGHVCQQIRRADGTLLGLRASNRDISDEVQAEEERQAHIRFLESLERIDQAIRRETNVEAMLWSVIRAVFEIFASDRAWLLYPCDPEAPSFRVPVEVCRPEYPGAEILNLEVPIGPGQAAEMRQALASPVPILNTNGTDRPVSRESASQFGVQAQMYAAIYPKLGRPWIFGLHQCSHPRLWTAEEQRLFQEIGRRLADGLSSVLFLQEVQESEERFRAFFEQAAVGMGHLAPDGRWLRVNGKLCDIVGYGKEDLQRLTLQDLLPDDDPAAGQTTAPGPGAGEPVGPHQERRFRRRDGTLIWVNLTLSLVRQASGEPAYSLAVVEDISARKEAEAERLRLQEQLVQAQKLESVGRLAGGVAHDYNNMLSVIIGSTEMALADLPPGSPLHDHLTHALAAARRSADITRQLLAFARRQTIVPRVLCLNEAVARMLTMLRRLIGEDIELVWRPRAGLPPVKMDPSQLDQILANLCVNARDAITDGGRIFIETDTLVCDEADCAEHAGCSPGPYVLLAVSDDGCGMDKGTVAQIFEPFFTTKDVGKGTGLGLATVYGIVQQNRGFITVSSAPLQGTTFRIFLPCHDEGPSRPAAVRPDRQQARGSETILVVEDEPILLDMVRRMLTLLGYRVLAAATPGEAIRLAEEEVGAIRLLLADVVMPEMNGRELAVRLQALCPGLKSLFMSGYTANVIAQQGVLDEGICFLPKPFSMEDLGAKIQEVLG